MRHYSDTLSAGVFLTFMDRNTDLIGVDPDEALLLKDKGSVLSRLIECLEVRHCDVIQFFMKRDASSEVNPYDCGANLSPNEVRVLDEFFSFQKSARDAREGTLVALNGDPDWTVRVVDTFVKTFVYTNLNEGKSVVWTVSLMA